MKSSTCCVVVAALFATSVVHAGDHTGTWTLDAQRLVVELRQDAAGGLSGTVVHAGAHYGVRGKVEGELAKGIYHNDLAAIFFEARLKGEGLEFVILESMADSAEYVRHVHLLARKVDAPAVAGGHRGEMVEHPAGFGMWIPSGWRAEESGGMLRLLPPAENVDVLGKAEVILVIAVDLGASATPHKPDDPRVVHFLDSMAQNISSDLRRDAAPAVIARGRQRGVFLDWVSDAVDPTARRCHAWVSIIGRRAVTVLAAGPGVQLADRVGALRLVFVSFGFEDGGMEPAMMRTWSFQSVARLEAAPAGTREWPTRRRSPDEGATLILNADGTFERTREGVKEPREGLWATATGALHLVHGDVREVYEYSIAPEDDGMKLRLQVGERGETWIRQ